MSATPSRLTFVREAGAVERALAGEPFGDDAVSVRFGVAGGRFVNVSRAQRERAAARFGVADVATGVAGGDVAVGAVGDAVVVRVVQAAREDFVVIDTRGWEYAMALEHADDAVVVVGPDFAARVDLDPVDAQPKRAVVATWLEDERVVAPLENTLRVLSAYLCLAKGGVLLHCCGVVHEEGARVCFGPSGIGKSTLASSWLARGGDIVSDELCAVVPAGQGRYAVEQVPFAGDVAARAITGARVPLAGLHRLDQGEHSALLPMSSASASAALFACAPFVNVDARRRPLLFENLERLAKHARVTRLVVKLGDDVAALWNGMGPSTSFRLPRGVRYRLIDGEALLVLQESAEAVGLNGTGSRAFDLAARGETFAAIVAAIGGEVDDVDAADLERDLRVFFGDVVGAGLLEVAP